MRKDMNYQTPKKLNTKLSKITIPENYDYVGVYLTDKCHLNCDYCITKHHGASFIGNGDKLESSQWIEGLNRFVLPKGVPVTLQGGEPFLYKGIWNILDNIEHKADILTALPPFLKIENFKNLKSLDWNKREAPYPRIRVSYHKTQHDYRELIERIAELQEIVSIGLYYLKHPEMNKEEIILLEKYAKKFNVKLRSKDFLGFYKGKQYGELFYKDAADGIKKDYSVMCKNSVVPIAPDGSIYRCHSDLYFKRKGLALGTILDDKFEFPLEHLSCSNYGLCNECDIKVKTNHNQVFGYTSVEIRKAGVRS